MNSIYTSFIILITTQHPEVDVEVDFVISEVSKTTTTTTTFSFQC